MKLSKDLVAASATPLILSVLLQGESYGYEIIRRVRALSGSTIEWSEGMVYPALRRLEREDLLKARWVVSDAGRRRRYYKLTAKGVTSLEGERRAWLSVHNVLSRLWNSEPWATSTGL